MSAADDRRAWEADFRAAMAAIALHYHTKHRTATRLADDAAEVADAMAAVRAKRFGQEEDVRAAGVLEERTRITNWLHDLSEPHTVDEVVFFIRRGDHEKEGDR